MTAADHHRRPLDHRLSLVKSESPPPVPFPAATAAIQSSFIFRHPVSFPSSPLSRSVTTVPAQPFSFSAATNLSPSAASDSWPPPQLLPLPSLTSHHHLTLSSNNNHNSSNSRTPANLNFNFSHPHPSTMSYSDEYDEADDLGELPSLSPSRHGAASAAGQDDRSVRRRSSKACDQCRKSKCKCERSPDGETCKNCIILNTPCTFLGPSRKRGPPKGYIDAIEARLHQMEALLGVILSSSDERAVSLLDDLKNDPLAEDIINRVDNSLYGVKGRRKLKESQRSANANPGLPKTKQEHDSRPEFANVHPTNEWQDQTTLMLSQITESRSIGRSGDNSTLSSQHPNNVGSSSAHAASGGGADLDITGSGEQQHRPQLHVISPAPPRDPSVDSNSPGTRRLRRRVDGNNFVAALSLSPENRSPPTPSLSMRRDYPYSTTTAIVDTSDDDPHSQHKYNSRHHDQPASDDQQSAEELGDAVGQLSLNEDENFRYHGKASGLHLLEQKISGEVARNEGRIWRMPSARVWPPIPASEDNKHASMSWEAAGGSSSANNTTGDGGVANHNSHTTTKAPELPSPEHQNTLLDLYFTYVHPIMPILHKGLFYERLNYTDDAVAASPQSDGRSTTGSSSMSRARLTVPPILLLAMFAVSARYASPSQGVACPPPPLGEDIMWPAGDEYLKQARVLLDGSYGSSRPATVQALLLMGYRELGIGAMAQAWIYIGMAVRMAQDLGLHRNADRWSRSGRGKLFSDLELQERRRIWYGCVTMDKYISAYIGRPLAIFSGDYDVELLGEEEADEQELWQPFTFPTGDISPSDPPMPPPQPGRHVSSFNASVRISTIMSEMISCLYAPKPTVSRRTVRTQIESALNKWYLDLPEHLRWNSTSSRKGNVPTLCVFTLHMQYWTAILLLHRPFAGNGSKTIATSSPDPEERHDIERSYQQCVGAANHITSLVSHLMDTYSICRGSVFLIFYIFTASITHVTTLTSHPSDPQARLGLKTCMDALFQMSVVWPSAKRALDLLRECKVNLGESELHALSVSTERQKRPSEADVDFEDVSGRGHLLTTANVATIERSNSSGSVDFITPVRSQQPRYQPAPGGYSSYITGTASSENHLPPSGSLSAFNDLFDRWSQPAGPSSEPFQFSTALSTSVLPQLYSTGLPDDRLVSEGVHHQHHHHHSRMMHNPVVGNQGSGSNNSASHLRFPQYWQDPSIFPQLGTAYGMVPQHQHSAPPSAHPSQQQGPPHPSHSQEATDVYSQPEQYGLYRLPPSPIFGRSFISQP